MPPGASTTQKIDEGIEKNDLDLLKAALSSALPPNEIRHLLKDAITHSKTTIVECFFSHPHIHQAFLHFSDDTMQTLWNAALQQKSDYLKIAVALKILIRSLKHHSTFTFEDSKQLLPKFETLKEAPAIFEHAQKAFLFDPDARFMFCFGFEFILQDLISEKKCIHQLPIFHTESEDNRFVQSAKILFKYPLHRAVKAFYLDELLPSIELLIKSGIDLNQRLGPHQETVLSIAVKEGKTSLVEFLLQQKEVDPTLCDSDGETLLHIAIGKNHPEIVALLLQHPKAPEIINKKNNQGMMPLYVGLRWTALTRACKVLLADSRLTAFTTLADNEGNNLLHIAAQYNKDPHVEALSLFLEKKQITKSVFNEKNNKGLTPFFLAIDKNNHAVAMKLLQDPRMDLTTTNKEGSTPLHAIIKLHNLNAIDFLIKAGLDINAQTSDSKSTALHIAGEYYSHRPHTFFQLFNTPGIEVNLQNSKGNTACHNIILDIISQKVDKSILEYMEAKLHLIFKDPRVDIGIQNHEGHSLLKLAIRQDSIVIFKLLVVRLKMEGKPLKIQGNDTIPDPEINLKALLEHPALQNSPNITASLSFESILKNNPNLTCEGVFEKLKAQYFPCHEAWSKEHKKIAFEYAQQAINEAISETMSDGTISKTINEEMNAPLDLYALGIFWNQGLLNAEHTDKLSGAAKTLIAPARKVFIMMHQLAQENPELMMKICKSVYDHPQNSQSFSEEDLDLSLQRLTAKYKK